MKNMKTRYRFLLLVSMTIFSCDQVTIELDPIGDTEAGFFQNETQMTQAVMGIYQKMNFFYGFRGGAWLSGIWLLPDDNLTTQGAHQYENFVGLNGSNASLGLYYQYGYQLIARANTVLQKIEENKATAYRIKPELMNYHQGEALFLRAWMYFRLWNTFGNAVPLVAARITSLDDAYPPSCTGTQMADQAIADLQEAATLLPESWDEANKGRVTRNSALGLAGKILVFRGTIAGQAADFTAALTAFNNITGASLMPNYGDNFRATMENNAESLFEFQANDQGSQTNPFLNNDEFSVVGELGAYMGIFTQEPSWIGSNYYTATQAFKDALEPGDPRSPYLLNLDAPDLRNVVKYIKDGNRVGNWAAGYNLQRNNLRILRYADVVLLKAEALVRSGGSKSEAIGLINQVRERARKSTADGTEAAVPADLNTGETNAGTILDWIFRERRIELAFEEGHRWFDLRRRHLAGEIDLKTWDFASLKPDFNFDDFNVSFPIPEGEIIQNPKLIQNTGY
ncbi:MAG: RagB/SusD family nutrient uptake outer membrane protein [Mangrovibacterium sp.]|nr:RagB/SusD family nutrient uptake outer membrane protein [Mangrovibacterium sp.]